MAWLLVAKMVKAVVEMVEKMGFLVEKEEEEGGEVVVVGMEEEMEERMVEELVEKWVVMAGQEGRHSGYF